MLLQCFSLKFSIKYFHDVLIGRNVNIMNAAAVTMAIVSTCYAVNCDVVAAIKCCSF